MSNKTLKCFRLFFITWIDLKKVKKLLKQPFEQQQFNENQVAVIADMYSV